MGLALGIGQKKRPAEKQKKKKEPKQAEESNVPKTQKHTAQWRKSIRH